MTGDFSLIVADEIDNTQRTLLHELIKEHSDDWWHDLPNVWVAKGGGSAHEWFERIQPLVPLSPSTVMVLALQTTPGNRWAAKGALSSIGRWWRDASKPEGPDDPSGTEP
jgi:hypothetical protein